MAQSGDNGKNDGGAVFGALLKSDSFKALVRETVLEVLKSPGGTSPFVQGREKVKETRLCQIAEARFYASTPTISSSQTYKDKYTRLLTPVCPEPMAPPFYPPNKVIHTEQWTLPLHRRHLFHKSNFSGHSASYYVCYYVSQTAHSISFG